MFMSHPRSPTLQNLTAYMGANGAIKGLRHDVVSGWVGARFGEAFLINSVDKKGKIDAWSINGADHWYDVPHQTVRAIQNDLVQNSFPIGAVRSVANNYTVFAVESFIDEIAHNAGKDPLEFRLKNASKEGDRRVDGVIFNKVGNVEVLEAAKGTDHYKSKLQGKNRGRGIASGFWFNAGLQSSVNISVNPDGTVSLIEGSVDIGGTRSSISMQAAEDILMIRTSMGLILLW